MYGRISPGWTFCQDGVGASFRTFRWKAAGEMKRVLMAFVRAYRKWLSPLFPPSCRYRPTCSAYALEALELHGALWGSWLTLRRLLRCHPLRPGGFDPVPRPMCEGRLENACEMGAENCENLEGKKQASDTVDTDGNAP